LQRLQPFFDGATEVGVGRGFGEQLAPDLLGLIELAALREGEPVEEARPG
jgi:hypothetical protein